MIAVGRQLIDPKNFWVVQPFQLCFRKITLLKFVAINDNGFNENLKRIFGKSLVNIISLIS